MYLVKSIAMGLVLLVITACGFLGERRSWTEDVQLDDGSIVRIERYVKFSRSNSWSGDAPSATEERSTLKFTGDLARLPTWDVPLMPLVLYRDGQTKEWVIVAGAGQCEVWYRRGTPFPPYWEYRLSGGQWREQVLSQSSKGRVTNLFFNYLGPVARHVSVKSTQELVADLRMDDIYRRVVPSMTRYCMVTAK